MRFLFAIATFDFYRIFFCRGTHRTRTEKTQTMEISFLEYDWLLILYRENLKIFLVEKIKRALKFGMEFIYADQKPLIAFYCSTVSTILKFLHQF